MSCECNGTTHTYECLPISATDEEVWLAQERADALFAQQSGTQDWVIDVINARERVRRLINRRLAK